MAALPSTYLTPEQYLEIERAAEYKSEYLNGRMWPLGGTPHGMSGGRRFHSMISLNVAAELLLRLKGRCRVFNSDMRVRVSESGLYTYPDVSVVCGKPEHPAEDLLSNPTLIIEVLSPTTEKNDRGMKFHQYQRLQSLREYGLVSQFEPRVELFRRKPEGLWSLHQTFGLDGHARFESADCEVAMADIYADVQFQENSSS